MTLDRVPGARMRAILAAVAACTLICAMPAVAQPPAPETPPTDTRTQYPLLLANSYFSLNVGALDYPFSSQQLEPGFTVQAVQIPRVAVRAMLIGHEFSKYFAVQAHYLRPVSYVRYENVNGTGESHRMLVHFGGVTAKGRVPMGAHLAVYGEGGIGVTSRNGFESGTTSIVRDAHYGNALIGGGIEYHATPNWDFIAGTLLSPGNDAQRQPRTLFTSGGFRYTLRPLPDAVVQSNREAGYVFPEHIAQVSYTTDTFGYGLNTLVSKKVPVFWGGNVKVARGWAAHYEQNVFHTRKTFALDIGGSAGFWRSREDADWIRTMSIYPLLRWTLVRTAPADMYVMYSLAGPSWISRTSADGLQLGNHFTFQDFMGAGFFFGRGRHYNAGVKINHYSNGNIFNENAGVKIPYTFNVGYAF